MIVAGKYKLARKLGQGSFGSIFLCEDMSSGTHYAIKIQKKGQGQLAHQSLIYEHIAGLFGFPQAFYSGSMGQNQVLVIQLLGPSIDRLRMQCKGMFSLHTTAMVGHQMVTRLQYLHLRGIVHRDVKPENMMLKDSDSRILYLIDMGLAVCQPWTETSGFAGTELFASRWAMQGQAPHPRDDLESLLYSLVYLLTGNLPWHKLPFQSTIHEKERFMQQHDSPLQIIRLYVAGLEHQSEIDYDLLRGMLQRISGEIDLQFDWIRIKNNNHVKLNLV